MITTYIIGQILGVTLLVVGIAIIINTKNVYQVVEKLTKDSPSIWLSGFISLLFGATLLAFSNFSNGLSSMLAILGILSFLKGISLLWFPKIKMFRRVANNRFVIILLGLIDIIIAIYLISKSF